MKTEQLFELTTSDLDQVTGGMKWDRGYVNPDVIDARGGQFNFLGLTFTLDLSGHVSSITPTPSPSRSMHGQAFQPTPAK